MHTFLRVVFAFSVALAGCKGEVKPQLSLEGHWRVQHGFDPGCQVSMTFTGALMVVAFYNLAEGACRSDTYGMDNHVLAIQIDDRTDFINDEGLPGARLKVSMPARSGIGSVTLWQTAQGLAGAIDEGSDADGLLEPLLGPTYQLSALPSHWLGAIDGAWVNPCNQIFVDNEAEEICPELHVTNSHQAKTFGIGRTAEPFTRPAPRVLGQGY